MPLRAVLPCGWRSRGFNSSFRRSRRRSLSGNVGPGQRLDIAAAVLADASLLENPLGTVRTFAFLAGLAAKASAVAGTELNVIGVGLLANGAGFHGRR